MKNKLIVCGDSYMCPVIGEYAGTHFSEIIARHYDLDLIAFSRGGMSNAGICLQVEEAIKMQPELILLSTSFYDRWEWPMGEIDAVGEFDIQHLLYDDHRALSGSYKWLNQKACIISTALADVDVNRFGMSLKFFNTDRYGKERLKALQDYLLYLYHPSWKKQTDKWMLYGMLRKLHESKIKYVLCYEQSVPVAAECSWLNYGKLSLNVATHEIMKFIEERPSYKDDPGYHTLPSTQRKIAEILIKNYVDKLFGQELLKYIGDMSFGTRAKN